MKPVTRRSVIAGSAAAVAAVPALVLAEGSEPRLRLSELIEEHRDATRGVERVQRKLARIEKVLEQEQLRNPIMACTGVLPNGERWGTHYELGKNTDDQIHRAITESHKHRREMYTSQWMRDSLPDISAALEKEIDESERRALNDLKRQRLQFEARQAGAGLPEMNAAMQQAYAVEERARARLVLYVPSNAEEARAKAHYIGRAYPFRDGWCAEEDFVQAILDLTSGVSVSA